MSVEFSNAYQEILLDNLVAIIKQNFVFQTQLKLAEDVGKAKEEIQLKYNELLQAHETLKDFKIKSDINTTAHEEKSRLQSALNDMMKKNSALQKDIESKNKEIEALKEYTKKLETITSVSKLKKINLENKSEQIKNSTEIIADGSSF